MLSEKTDSGSPPPAAFVAQHSIFPQVGTNRPDEEDIRRIAAFVRQFRRKIDSAADSASLQEVVPPGGRPYKTPGKCRCDRRAAASARGAAYASNDAPVQAIPAGRPRQTDPQKCIACGRCIVVCPARARRFGGLLYKIVRRKFVKTLFRAEGAGYLCVVPRPSGYFVIFVSLLNSDRHGRYHTVSGTVEAP